VKGIQLVNPILLDQIDLWYIFITCKGVTTEKGTNWWTIQIDLTISSGAMHHPIFHPVTPNILPIEPIVMVRSNMPGKLADKNPLSVSQLGHNLLTY
jgi:hypothetical protein